jgi:myosin heavy subunit
LLEKSRVIRQAPGERCYHIFYQIFSGYKPELIKELQLDKPLKDYWYVIIKIAIDQDKHFNKQMFDFHSLFIETRILIFIP